MAGGLAEIGLLTGVLMLGPAPEISAQDRESCMHSCESTRINEDDEAVDKWFVCREAARRWADDYCRQKFLTIRNPPTNPFNDPENPVSSEFLDQRYYKLCVKKVLEGGSTLSPSAGFAIPAQVGIGFSASPTDGLEKRCDNERDDGRFKAHGKKVSCEDSCPKPPPQAPPPPPTAGGGGPSTGGGSSSGGGSSGGGAGPGNSGRGTVVTVTDEDDGCPFENASCCGTDYQGSSCSNERKCEDDPESEECKKATGS